MLFYYASIIWIVSAIICFLNFESIADTDSEDYTRFPNWIVVIICICPGVNSYVALACLKDWYHELKTKFIIWRAKRIVTRIKKKHNLK